MLFNFQIIPRKDKKALADEQCDKVEIYHSEPEIIEPEKQQPTTWFIQYKIPLDVLGAFRPVTKPQPGVTWRANLYKCGDKTSHPHWLTWSVVDRPEPDFHVPESFGTLEFA